MTSEWRRHEEYTIDDLKAEIERLRRRLYEVDAQLTAEDRIHARECMALRAEKDAEIERLKADYELLKGDYNSLLADYELVRRRPV